MTDCYKGVTGGKNWSSRRFLKEFASKAWCRSSLDQLIKKIDAGFLKFASHHFLLYAVYICKKSLNFTYAFKCYQQKCKLASL